MKQSDQQRLPDSQTYASCFATKIQAVYRSGSLDAGVKCFMNWRIYETVQSVEVMFEQREISVVSGSFIDSFEAMDVHVYRWRVT